MNCPMLWTRCIPAICLAVIREMLIKGILPVISPQMQKCDFVFAYKSGTYAPDLGSPSVGCTEALTHQRFLSTCSIWT